MGGATVRRQEQNAILKLARFITVLAQDRLDGPHGRTLGVLALMPMVWIQHD
jgi:hypothetical protein